MIKAIYKGENMLNDLWKYLKDCKKPIVLYGMGNGADKIITVLESRGIKFYDDRVFSGLKHYKEIEKLQKGMV